MVIDGAGMTFGIVVVWYWYGRVGRFVCFTVSVANELWRRCGPVLGRATTVTAMMMIMVGLAAMMMMMRLVMLVMIMCVRLQRM